MVGSISIKNFKSLKDVSFESRRVNIFIGEPNTGKSNLLEALGVFSLNYTNARNVLRYKTLYDLFFDTNVAEPITIAAGAYSASIEFWREKCLVKVSDANTVDLPELEGKALNNELALTLESDRTVAGNIDYSEHWPFRYYKFYQQQNFPSDKISFLSTPYGDNLVSILRSNGELRELVRELIESKGYKLNLRIESREIELVKDNGVLISYPYQSVSDTLQRIIFYLAAIKSNKNATLLLEEPETHIFPFYTKYLAELMALQSSNQYFIVTHNPYFLLSLVEKTPIDELAVFITYMEKYETKLRQLSNEELSELLDLNTDIFFNLDKFLTISNEPLS